MKKTPATVFALLLSTLLAALALHSGCRTRQPDVITLRFWAMGAEGEHVQKLIPEFERRNPGIRVTVQTLPWTAAHEKLLTAFAGGSLPDLCQLGNTWVPEFTVLNALEPLDARIAASPDVRKQGFFDGIWDTNVIDGVVRGVPWYVDTRVMFYRTDILARAGFPNGVATWDELHRACAAIKASMGARHAYAIFLPVNEWNPPVIFGMQAGSRLLKDNNTAGDFSGEDFVRAFTFYARFFTEGLAPPGMTEVTNVYQGFAEGFFAMYITGPWNIGEFSRRLPADMQDKWMTAPMPGPVAGAPGVSLAGGASLVMFRSSPRKDAAWKLVEYLSTPEVQQRLYELTGDLPARREAWDAPLLRTNRYAAAFRRQLDHVRATPKIPEWERIAQKLLEYCEAVSIGRADVRQALQAYDRDVNEILEKRRWIVESGK